MKMNLYIFFVTPTPYLLFMIIIPFHPRAAEGLRVIAFCRIKSIPSKLHKLNRIYWLAVFIKPFFFNNFFAEGN